MKELNRQVVIFGNFNSVTFESILELSDLREKYSLQVNAMPDLPPLPNPKQPINVHLGVVTSRPILQTSDKKITVFFGSTRIHIEQIDSPSESYTMFNDMAIDIILNVIKRFGLTVTRVALNGKLYSDSKDLNEKVFNSIFNKSKLYANTSNEWNLRICDKESNSELGCEINKIAQYARGKFIDVNGQELDGLIATYDFNSQVNGGKIFAEVDINKFSKLAKEYRALFL